MNWGKGIAIALALFMGFIIYLGVTLMSKNVDLVADDYYQQEIDYENEINAQKNAQNLKEQPSIVQEDEYVIVKVPEGPFDDMKLVLERPNNDELDQDYSIEGTRTFLIEKSTLEKGQYLAVLQYTFDGAVCQQETELYINK